MTELCGVGEALRERHVRHVARVVVVLPWARQTVAHSCVGWSPCSGLLRRGSLPRRRGARVWLPGRSIRWVGCLWCGAKLSCPVLGDVEGLGAGLVENRSC